MALSSIAQACTHAKEYMSAGFPNKLQGFWLALHKRSAPVPRTLCSAQTVVHLLHQVSRLSVRKHPAINLKSRKRLRSVNAGSV